MKKLVFMGSKSTGLSALKVMAAQAAGQLAGVITVDDAADGRSCLREIIEFAGTLGIPFRVLRAASEQEAAIRSLSPDAVIVVGWYWILSPGLLALVPGGFAGCHASLLPAYRGNAPLVWAVLRGERRTGVTLFQFDNGMDTGEIIDQIGFEIGPDDHIDDVLLHADRAIVDLVSAYVRNLLEDRVSKRPQDSVGVSYTSLRRPQDGLIEWHRSARDVHNFVRAQSRPYPGAFTILSGDRRIRIWKTSVFPHAFYGIPGLVCQTTDTGVVVCCGEGAIIVSECQIDGESERRPQDLLRWGQRCGMFIS